VLNIRKSLEPGNQHTISKEIPGSTFSICSVLNLKEKNYLSVEEFTCRKNNLFAEEIRFYLQKEQFMCRKKTLSGENKFTCRKN